MPVDHGIGRRRIAASDRSKGVQLDFDGGHNRDGRTDTKPEGAEPDRAEQTKVEMGSPDALAGKLLQEGTLQRDCRNNEPSDCRVGSKGFEGVRRGSLRLSRRHGVRDDNAEVI